MEELRDIQGLDQISSWPLALGWWLIIAMLCVILAIGVWLIYKKIIYIKSWQYKSYLALQQIEQQVSDYDAKQILHRLAVEIRRIGMLSAARETCAGLMGKQWLSWLQDHDPYSFNWLSEGQVLVQYQYMPDVSDFDKHKLQLLINAAKNWVRRC